MAKEQELSPELQQSLRQVLDGHSEEIDFGKLEELLAQDPNARSAYLDAIDLHARLFLELHPQLILTTAGESVPSIPPCDRSSVEDDRAARLRDAVRRRFARRWVEGLAIAGALLLAFWLGRGSTSRVDPSPDAPLFVARLVNNTGSVFNASTGQELVSGAKIKTRETLTLIEGIAHLEFDEGPAINLEGPAAMRVDNSGVPVLEYGKMFLRLPRGEKSFAVQTSLGSVHLDGDDAAGIVLHGSDIQVHAFHGEVAIGLTQTADMRLVSQGTAICLYRGASGSIRRRRLKYDADAFPSRLLLNSNQLLIPQNYVEEVKKSRPICYWRFEEATNGYVNNEVAGGLRCKIGGRAKLALQGDNHVVQFGFGPNGGFMASDGELNELAGSDYTVEAWVKPSHSHWGTILGFVRRRNDDREIEDHGLALEIHSANHRNRTKPRAFRFLHRSPPGPYSRSGTSCFSSEDYEIRRWQHLVAVKDRTHMRLYVNGRLSSSVREKTSMSDGFTIIMGQLFTFDSVRPFSGQLDEVAIYDRALKGSDIQRHFKAVR